MKKLVIGLACSVLISTGCSNSLSNNNHANHTEKETPKHEKPAFFQGDIREETSSIEHLPDFLQDKPEEIQVIYISAAKHEELLSHIPCYCGCGTSAGHRSSYDCFVHEKKDNGSIVWDDHGTKCGVCLEIAATSVLEYSNGTSIKKIRDLIDESYKEGFSIPTPTPVPEES
ncbi:PCYCGC domain-containing protein [Sutcliffiella rhizosphaerae]|uniref:Lipoprotein n=1 Tax=Sutcliffiella rhizosphaerae TaxID=2880967 RepID=A0ABM8YPU3_9BACI|nr:PCYCGC domain-containing protein [Sutcliffiella rhizosphaerae]CAG9621999.1 hypothetical protein BACCIP111883_02790 [Sutcliffiella rhizosphaerae]